jgi:nucleoside-diphosphate-sugar epimerase
MVRLAPGNHPCLPRLRRITTGNSALVVLFAVPLQMAKLIFGCGYLGLRVARLWVAASHTVFAVTRTEQRAAEIAAAGVQPIIGDLLGTTPLVAPQAVDTVLFAVGYNRSGGHSIHDLYVGGLARAIDWTPQSVDRFLYISSTGVYGQSSGEEVDESSPCEPTREGGTACLAAERLLSRSRVSSRAVMLRLAGLYGPGRIPRSADLQAGRPIDAPASGWLNLIHVDDAARIVLLAEERAAPPRTYVVSDGQPVLRSEYYGELARLLSVPPPQLVAPPANSPAAQRAGSDKRINPRRMFDELRPTLLYPDYRAGLAAIVAK